jgi:Holliday junction resolvasome RuvABC endonuclease subunit
VLSLAPSSRGVGFAVFEGERTLLDWGVRYVKKEKNKESIAKVRALIEAYQPEILVIEDYAGPGSWRHPRIRYLIRMIRRLATQESLDIREYSRGQVRACFAPPEKPTKYEIGQKIVSVLPELQSRLPKKRRPWTSEHPYMALFDAIALALCYFHASGP